MTCSKSIQSAGLECIEYEFLKPIFATAFLIQILLMRYVPFKSHSCHCSLMKHKILFFHNHWFCTVSCLIVWWDSLYFRCSFPAFYKHPVVYCFPYLIKNIIREVLMLYTFSLSVRNSYDYLIIWAFLLHIWIYLVLSDIVGSWPPERLTLQLLCNLQPLEIYPLLHFI